MRYVAVFDTNILISALLSTSGSPFSRTLKAVPDDPDDDMIVECAVVGNVTHIVTGDKHLLALRKYQEIAIVKAAEFIDLLSQF